MFYRIALFLVNLWNDTVKFLVNRLAFLKKKLQPKPQPAVPAIIAEELPEIHLGDVAINPEWRWIKVANPKGRRTGNGFHDFGDSAGIKAGGKLTTVAVDGDQVLVSYQSPKGQGFGSEAGNGTLFFVPKRVFEGMTQRHDRVQADVNREKAYIMSLLKGTPVTESDSPTPAPTGGAAS